MDMRNILSNCASKVGYEIKFYHLQYSDCTTYLHQFWSLISYNIISNYRFLCVARLLPFKDEDTQEQPSKPSKCKAVENMATTCHPGQLYVIFDICL